MIASSLQNILNIGLILANCLILSAIIPWMPFSSFNRQFLFPSVVSVFPYISTLEQSQNLRWGLSNHFRSFSKIDFWCHWKCHPQSQKLIQLIHCSFRLLLLRARYTLVKVNFDRTLVFLLSSHSHHRREALSSMAGSCWFIEQSLVFPRPVQRKIPESSMASIFLIRSCIVIVIF